MRATNAIVKVVVVAAVIESGDCFLVTRRIEGTHLPGMWEFPGGKIDQGESHEEALRREMREELDADVAVRDLILETTHEYSDRTVTLFFYRCNLLGTPAPMMGQEMQWAARKDLPSMAFPPADDELIRMLMNGAP